MDKYDIHIGRAEYLQENGIETPEVKEAGNRVFIAVDGKVEGCLIIKGRDKENAATALAALRDIGIKKHSC